MTIEPEGEKDYLGHTFKDLQGFVSDKMNKSFKDIEQTKSKLDKTDYENQSLRERLKDAEAKLTKRDDKVKREKAKVCDKITKFLTLSALKSSCSEEKQVQQANSENLCPLPLNVCLLIY